jgi:signal recognition particle receptor subunit beta
VPLLVLGNKQDIPDSCSEKDLIEVLGLSRIKERDWTICKCSAKTGQGLNESMDWIVGKLSPLL